MKDVGHETGILPVGLVQQIIEIGEHRRDRDRALGAAAKKSVRGENQHIPAVTICLPWGPEMIADPCRTKRNRTSANATSPTERTNVSVRADRALPPFKVAPGSRISAHALRKCCVRVPNDCRFAEGRPTDPGFYVRSNPRAALSGFAEGHASYVSELHQVVDAWVSSCSR